MTPESEQSKEVVMAKQEERPLNERLEHERETGKYIYNTRGPEEYGIWLKNYIIGRSPRPCLPDCFLCAVDRTHREMLEEVRHKKSWGNWEVEDLLDRKLGKVKERT